MPPFNKPHQISDPSCVKQYEGGSYKIEPKGLNIVWGNDPRYWKISSATAELIQVSWLEVSGAVELKEGKTYRVTFDVKVKEDGFGWSGTPVLVMAKLGKRGQYKYKEASLSPGPARAIPAAENLEIDVPQGAPDKKLYFGLYEVWSGKWKGGLEILKARIEPV